MNLKNLMKHIAAIFVVMLFFALSVGSGCQKKKTDTLRTCAMVLKTGENIRAEYAELMYNYIEETLSARVDLRIVDRMKVSAVQGELNFQQTEWSSGTKVAEIGNALNADLVCFVTIYESVYKVEFLNVNTFEKRTFTGRIAKGGVVKDLKDLFELYIGLD